MKYTCKYCGKIFEQKSYRRVYKNKFCSLSCSVSWNNTQRKTGKYLECNNCGKKIWVIPSQIERSIHHFCNRKCESEWRHGENHPRWTGGYSSDYGHGWKEKRRLALERDIKCKRCRTNKMLEIHHIIPFRISNDNSLDNLITLCKSCHSSIGNTYWKLENRPKYFENINSMRYK